MKWFVTCVTSSFKTFARSFALFEYITIYHQDIRGTAIKKLVQHTITYHNTTSDMPQTILI